MLNSFWCPFLLTLQLLRYKLHDKIYIVIAQKEEKNGADESLSSSSSATSTRSEYEPLSFVFICFFAAVLLIQFAAMCSHRIVTFIQVVRRTNLKLPRKMRKTLRYVHVISINDVCFNSTRLQFFGNLLDSEKDQTRRRWQPQIIAQTGKQIACISFKIICPVVELFYSNFITF